MRENTGIGGKVITLVLNRGDELRLRFADADAGGNVVVVSTATGNATDAHPSASGADCPNPSPAVAGKWATANGVRHYNGEFFAWRGRFFECGNRHRQWADIRALVESRETDGAARLPRSWRSKFKGNAEFKPFLDRVFPVTNRDGGGWYHLSSPEKYSF